MSWSPSGEGSAEASSGPERSAPEGRQHGVALAVEDEHIGPGRRDEAIGRNGGRERLGAAKRQAEQGCLQEAEPLIHGDVIADRPHCADQGERVPSRAELAHHSCQKSLLSLHAADGAVSVIEEGPTAHVSHGKFLEKIYTEHDAADFFVGAESWWRNAC